MKTMVWISVYDSLPEKNSYVLATNGKEIQICKYKGDHEKKFTSYDWYVGQRSGDSGGMFSSEPYAYDVYLKNVKIWMFLPEIPQIYFENVS